MKKINVLDKEIANKIAAGEVIERPASVVKELIENSIDAGAAQITVEISGGGAAFLRITDNGSGIYREDVIPAFYRHATSKIRSSEDLFSIQTLGFRGEALASVAAVARVEMMTKQRDEDSGTFLSIEGGEVKEHKDIGCPDGTTITVRELFFNVPARLKFLKKDTTESSHIADIVEKLALSNVNISFKLINNGREILFTAGDGSLQNCIYSLFGRETAQNCLKVDYETHGMRVTGMIGKSELAKNNRNFQIFYINGRYIKNRTIGYALEEAYKNLMMVGKHPFAVLNIEVDPNAADINVHPAKLEVKFVNDKYVFDLVYWGTRNTLYEKRSIPVIRTEEPKRPAYRQPFFDFAKETVPNPPKAEQVKFQQFQPKYKTPEKGRTYEYEDFVSAVQQPKPAPEKEQKTELPEETREPIIKSAGEELPQYRIIGQVFESFILLEMDGELVLLDQHAAHERLRFEKLKSGGAAALSQVLLAPVIIKLSHIEHSLVNENKSFFEELGYSLENFGNSDIIIRQAPVFTEKDDVEAVFLELVQNLSKNSQNMDIETLDNAYNIMACRSAVKANHRLEEPEIKRLVDDVLKLPNINTCPHGRPIMFGMTKGYIEKQFKRT